MKTKCKLESCRGCAYEVEKWSKRSDWELGLVFGLLVVGLILALIYG